MKFRFFAVLLILWGIGYGFAPPQSEQQRQVPEPIEIERTGGPPLIPEVPRDEVICFALYTVQDGVLKLSAQLYPLEANEERFVRLEVWKEDRWEPVAGAPVNEMGWVATFRVEGWDSTSDWKYRVVHAGGATFEGRIRRDPVEKDEILVAAFTGNSNTDRGPRPDIICNVQAQDPDLLFFSGDQVYDHTEHTASWLIFGRQFRDIMRDRPTITIPDDHDVGQGNIWGEGGKKAETPAGSDGGFYMPVEYVNMVQRAQTSHLPDPYDPTPIQRGISVYYTSLTVGGIDFAVIEDRKWKTGPEGLIPQQGPRPDHINDPDYDRDSVDVPEARLLGERQIRFLREWGQDWEGAEMKAVLSQTIFAGGAHIHGRHDARLLADLDSNGWPQSGRNRALMEIRKFFGFHIAGDQHLATVIHHGVHSWEDSIYSFGVPSIVNYYGRWWWPLEDPLNYDPDNPLPFTGRYYDGLGNKLTMHAYANPTQENNNAAGYGLIRFDKVNRQITMEAWPRYVDVTTPDAEPYPGWPVTIHQMENYGREPLGYLPALDFGHVEDPVIQVVDEYLGEIVYTVRISGATWRPPVFKDGFYTVHAWKGSSMKTIAGLESADQTYERVIQVSLEDLSERTQ